MKKVTIDYDRLCLEIKKAGKTKEGFSEEILKSKNYIYNLKKSPTQPETVVNLMCTLLGIAPETVIQKPMENTCTPESAILKNIYTKVCEVASVSGNGNVEEIIRNEIALPIAEIAQSLEVIMQKVKANTIQIERVKDIVKDSMETEAQRAEKFLTEMLGGGDEEAEKIYKMADELCIKRSELMKAKKKLGVEPYTTGYGANKKAMWRV